MTRSHYTSGSLSRVVAVGALALALSLVGFTSAAHAMVINDQGSYVGVALSPDSTVPPAISSPVGANDCVPFLAPFTSAASLLASTGLCLHGGSILHQQDIYALYWDPQNNYFASVRDYVNKFLQDVGNDSGKPDSPYAVTSQYTDSGGQHADHVARFRGAHTDTTPFAGPNGCTTGTGIDYFGIPGQSPSDGQNTLCVTDAQVQSEIASMIAQIPDFSPNITADGYAPLITFFTPPGAVVCLHDAADSPCSANGTCLVSQFDPECLATSTSTVNFCSYHSQLNLDGVEVPYVVQPWTPVTACDEPDAIPLPTPDDPPVNPQDLTNSLGSKLLSPISQGQIAAITNPFGNGWFSSDGVETSDCAPLNVGRDLEPVNGNVYPLRRAFSDSGVISIDPNSPECAPNGDLQATFVAPDAVNPGDTVELDGSNSISSLLVTKYAWDFGDGATTSGPSVAHSYSKPGQYAIKLTVTDRGGNTSTLPQTVDVLGAGGAVPTTGPNAPGTSHSKSSLHASVVLLPASFHRLLLRGVPLKVMTNESAAAIVSVSISRKAAKQAQIKAGRGPAVVIGRGSLQRIVSGRLVHLRLPSSMVKKLRRLGHVTLTIKLTVVDGHGGKEAIDAAGRY